MLIISKITPQDTIITANKRQVLALNSCYLQQYQNNGYLAVVPNIVDYRTFLVQTWQQYSTKPQVLLDDYAQFLLWQNIIKNNTLTQQITPALQLNWLDNELVKKMQNEYAVVRQFRLVPSRLKNYFNQRVQLFTTCIEQYQNELKKENFVDEFDIAEALIKQDITLPNQIYHYGFKQPSPQQQALLTHFRATTLAMDINYGQIQQKNAYPSTEVELDAAVAWLASEVQQKPQQKLVLVIPQLSELQHQVVYKLDQAFGYHKHLVSQVDKAYNLSLGRYLRDYAMVGNAIDLLYFAQHYQADSLPIDLLKSVVVSPFIKGWQAELNPRHHLQAQLQQVKISKEVLINLAQINCPIFYQCLLALEQLENIKPLKKSHLDWMAVFNQILHTFGWAAQQGLSSEQYQLLAKYQDLQYIFCRLDQIIPTLSFKQALRHWSELLTQTIFQPKLSQVANVHILGQLEAQGLFFDQAWIMGLNSDFLPGQPKDYYFIEADIATQFCLPGSGYQPLEKEAQATLNQLTRLATVHYLSYAQSNKAKLSFASPYIDFSSPPSPFLPKKVVPTYKMYEFVVDNLAPPLQKLAVKGGVAILSSQSQCAFQGFSHRLNISQLSPASIGINPQDRGILLHKVLESIWQLLGSQSALKKLKNLKAFIQTQVQKIYPNTSVFWQIEAKRAVEILLVFLTAELERDAFSIVALEQQQHINIAGLSFRVRLDRIDKDDQGHTMIFDYKTGQVHLSDIGITRAGFSPTIKQPQLVIYALNNVLDALAFIQLNSEKVAYIGCAKNDILAKQLKKNSNSEQFLALQKYWQAQLKQTSLDFIQGKAAVLPTQGACDYCQLDTLCRVQK